LYASFCEFSEGSTSAWPGYYGSSNSGTQLCYAFLQRSRTLHSPEAIGSTRGFQRDKHQHSRIQCQHGQQQQSTAATPTSKQQHCRKQQQQRLWQRSCAHSSTC
jgi:hypothetical protein